MKVIPINVNEPVSTAKPIGIIRVKESEYKKMVQDLRADVLYFEKAGDTHRAKVMRELLENYRNTGNTMLQAGSVKLEIIEG